MKELILEMSEQVGAENEETGREGMVSHWNRMAKPFYLIAGRHRMAAFCGRTDFLPKPMDIAPKPYSKRYAQLLRMVQEIPPDMMIAVACPSVLGDTYSELLQSLSLLAEAGLPLIVSYSQPDAHPIAELAR